MALIRCVECGAEISDKARSCPKCGCPIDEIKKELEKQEENKKVNVKEKKINKKMLFIIGGILCFGILAKGIFSGNTDEGTNKNTEEFESSVVYDKEIEKTEFEMIESFLGVEVINEQEGKFMVDEEQQQILDSGIEIATYMGKMELSDLTIEQVDNGIVTAIYWYCDDAYSPNIYGNLIATLDLQYGEHNTPEEGNGNVLGLFQTVRNGFEGKNESTVPSAYGEKLYHWSVSENVHTYLGIDQSGRMFIFWYNHINGSGEFSLDKFVERYNGMVDIVNQVQEVELEKISVNDVIGNELETSTGAILSFNDADEEVDFHNEILTFKWDKSPWALADSDYLIGDWICCVAGIMPNSEYDTILDMITEMIESDYEGLYASVHRGEYMFNTSKTKAEMTFSGHRNME